MKLSLDIANLTAGYSQRKFKPEDVLDEVYCRIAEQGEQPVWISLRSRQDALARAQGERRLADPGRGETTRHRHHPPPGAAA